MKNRELQFPSKKQQRLVSSKKPHKSDELSAEMADKYLVRKITALVPVANAVSDIKNKE